MTECNVDEGTPRGMMEAMQIDNRIYRFVMIVEVHPGHPAYDDPEWAADAAHGALTNEYGLRATYMDITEVEGTQRAKD